MSRPLHQMVMDTLSGNNGGNFGADVLKRSSEELACLRVAAASGMVDGVIASAMAQLEQRMLLAASLLESEENKP